MDNNLKEEFDSICEDFGMTATTAFNIFAKAVVRERRIPFEIKSTNKGLEAFRKLRAEAAANGIQDMSLEEINEEIKKSRKGIET